MFPCIALLSDFGLRDTYVAAMKAVILATLPSATIIDLTHEIAPGDIQHGAFEIWRIKPYLPVPAILLGVVDPGVGTSRRPIAIQFPDIICVGPDNGLFSYLLVEHTMQASVEINPKVIREDPPSSTFHGRDLFAPAVAHLAGGASIESLGSRVKNLQQLTPPQLRSQAGSSIHGEVLHIDRFGNLITSIGRFKSVNTLIRYTSWLSDSEPFDFRPEQVRIQLEHAGPFALAETFGAVPSGSPLAYIGSSGLLEVAIRDGNAAQALQAKRGDWVNLNIA